MTTVEKLEQEIARLSGNDLAALFEWIDEFRARLVDRALEKDVDAGVFDELAEQALRDSKAGKCTPL